MNASEENSEGPLGRIMSATADMMHAEIRRIRASFDHSGIVGTALEEVVAKFLNDQLPISLRAVAGKVVDSAGARSRQVDVIIYDTSRTPVLFASSQGTQHLVPCEGVVAVIEVKARLTRAELLKSITHCVSVKQLNREAYLPTSITREHALYGRSWLVPPIYYTIFAFESDGTYAAALNDEIEKIYPLHEQIDSLICLDRGLCLNVRVEVVGTGSSTLIESHFTSTPGPETVKADIQTSNALVVWYGVLTSTVLERMPGPTIDITAYLRTELTVSGTVAAGEAGKALYERVTQQFAASIGLDADLLSAMQDSSTMTLTKMYNLMRHPMYAIKEETLTDPEFRTQVQMRIDSARQHSKSEWLKIWFPGQDPDSPIEQA